MPLESKLTQNLLKKLRDFGCLTFKIHGHLQQQAGWPDVLIIHKKFICFCEMKVGNNKLTPLQAHMIDLISQRNVKCYIIVFANNSIEILNHKQERIEIVLTAEGVFRVFARGEEL